MEKVMDQKIADSIEEHLDNYQELARKRLKLERRLEKAESEKSSVKDVIFQRVCDEYRDKLDLLAEDLKPVEKEIEKIRDMIQDQTEQIEDIEKDLSDQMDEFAFRHRVGEFGEQDLHEKKAPLEDDAQELRRRKRRLKKQLELLDYIPEEPEEEEEASAEAEVAAAAEAAAEAEGVENDDESQDEDAMEAQEMADEAAEVAADNDATDDNGEPEVETAAEEEAGEPAVGDIIDGDESNLVNPSEWMKEFQEDGKDKDFGRRTVDRVPAGVGGNDDPLANLADPTDEGVAAQQTSRTAAATKAPPKAFPVLIITKGPGSGKKLPLVPMTMTIGREHDNNIELKDEEVARYHARISFERGDYVLLDLDSASGTFMNDVKIENSMTLNHGDKIRVGATEMIIDFE